MPSVHRLVVPFDPAACPPQLARVATARVLERWSAVDRSSHSPRVVAVTDGVRQDWTGAALVTARPGTAYLKIVDAVGDVPSAVAAVVDQAREQGLAQVKWEGWTASGTQARAAGFTAMDSPRDCAPDQGQPPAGHVLWLDATRVSEPPYYRQTTNFTCGSVVALIAQAGSGAVAREALDRPAELTLWREATNFPACEPVGLGVAVRRAWPDSPVTVFLDVDRPVLLDSYSEDEGAWRAVLQRASRSEAARSGVAVDARRLALGDVRSAVAQGEHVLLLVSLSAMQGFDVPHWVLCHGAVPGATVIEDPWTNAATGDTWVDAHLLPVPDTALEAMAAVESDGFRGAVHIGGPR